jgi:integrase/recombinase XerC
MTQLAPIATWTTLPTLLAAAGERASLRFPEFFAANIRNPHGRLAHAPACAKFLS